MTLTVEMQAAVAMSDDIVSVGTGRVSAIRRFDHLLDFEKATAKYVRAT